MSEFHENLTFGNVFNIFKLVENGSNEHPVTDITFKERLKLYISYV